MSAGTLPRTVLVLLALLLLGTSAALSGADLRLDTLQAGQTTYRDVRIHKVSAQSLLIVHSGGVAQLPLRDLSPELQVRFGYDPERARMEEQGLRGEREARARLRPVAERVPAPAPVEREWLPEVDLRPRIFELGLYAKRQGRRPSCAVFATLGALEFHHTLQQGKLILLSEEFLIWATRQINPAQNDYDGFTFAEVFATLRQFGVARMELMPNTLGGPVDQLQPSPQAREDGLSRRIFAVRGAVGAVDEKIAGILEELNQGYPVVVSMAWPQNTAAHTLRDQPVRPGPGHAVAIVGYHRPPTDPGELLFLFRNSYGLDWGVAGYGFVSDSYLQKHLWEVLTLRLGAN